MNTSKPPPPPLPPWNPNLSAARSAGIPSSREPRLDRSINSPPGGFRGGPQPSHNFSMSPANNMTRRDIPTFFADDDEYYQDQSVPCVVSWLIVNYVSSEKLELRLFFIRQQELCWMDPSKREIVEKHSLDQLSKLSYDQEMLNNDWKLFRLVFGKKVKIILSRDGNEIVNAIVSRMKQRRKEQLDFFDNHRLSWTDSELSVLNDRPATRFDQLGASGFMEDGSPNGDHVAGHLNETQEDFLYTFTIQSGFYQYHVFGVNQQGKLFPHTLGLFSHFIKHTDSRTKRVFAQHTYTHITAIESTHPTKITIKYSNDRDYSFIVSDHDRTEVLSLLKGRAYLYEYIQTPLLPDDALSTNLEQAEEQQSVVEAEDFPSKFSYQNESIANADPYRYDPQMIEAMEILTRQPNYLNQLNIGLEENDQGDDALFDMLQMDDSGVSPDTRVNNLKRGTWIWKDQRRKKKGSVHKRYMRVDLNNNECRVKWGAKPAKMNRTVTVVDIITGPEARLQQNKANPEYSFILKTRGDEEVHCVARDRNEFLDWSLGLNFLLRPQGSRRIEAPHNTAAHNPRQFSYSDDD